jgi:hypothetical protein
MKTIEIILNRVNQIDEKMDSAIEKIHLIDTRLVAVETRSAVIGGISGAIFSGIIALLIKIIA